jgi:hypothetical protein
LALTPAFQLALTSGAVACAMHTIESASQIAFRAALELDFSRGFMVCTHIRCMHAYKANACCHTRIPNVDAKDTEIPRMVSLSKFTTDDHQKELASALLFGEVWTNLANTLPPSSS